jgi:hypothetical protein
VRERLEATLSRLPVRSVDMTKLLDTVLVCAVLTILIVRTQLYLTNYPQLGGHGLHIAHLLWGGLLMLISIGALLAFISPGIRQVAAVTGGIGLGLFIDELGKFVTADNNYFFKPTAAIIYCFFILAFLGVRQLGRRRAYSQREYLVNVIEIVKEAALHDMDVSEHRRAQALLARADQADPLVPELHRLLDHVRSLPLPPPSPLTRGVRRLRAWLFDVVEQPGFPTVVITLFVVWVVGSLLQIVALIVFAASGFSPQPVFRLGHRITDNPLGSGELNFIQWFDFAASVLATAFVLIGLNRFRQGSRTGAFLMFERALLISLFFTQVFAFVHSQFAAVFGFLFDVVLFLVVRTILSHDLEQEALDDQRRWASTAPQLLSPSARSL